MGILTAGCSVLIMIYLKRQLEKKEIMKTDESNGSYGADENDETHEKGK